MEQVVDNDKNPLTYIQTMALKFEDKKPKAPAAPPPPPPPPPKVAQLPRITVTKSKGQQRQRGENLADRAKKQDWDELIKELMRRKILPSKSSGSEAAKPLKEQDTNPQEVRQNEPESLQKSPFGERIWHGRKSIKNETKENGYDSPTESGEARNLTYDWRSLLRPVQKSTKVNQKRISSSVEDSNETAPKNVPVQENILWRKDVNADVMNKNHRILSPSPPPADKTEHFKPQNDNDLASLSEKMSINPILFFCFVLCLNWNF